MTSELAVFAYLPGETTAVPVGLLEIEEDGPEVIGSSFVYGTRYLQRKNRIEIDPGAAEQLAPPFPDIAIARPRAR